MAIVTKPAPMNANIMPNSRPSEDMGVEGGYSIAMAILVIGKKLVELELAVYVADLGRNSLAAIKDRCRSVRFPIHPSCKDVRRNLTAEKWRAQSRALKAKGWGRIRYFCAGLDLAWADGRQRCVGLA